MSSFGIHSGIKIPGSKTWEQHKADFDASTEKKNGMTLSKYMKDKYVYTKKVCEFLKNNNEYCNQKVKDGSLFCGRHGLQVKEHVVNFETSDEKKNGKSLMEYLTGKRITVDETEIEEPSPDMVLNASKLKRFTGGDTLYARYLEPSIEEFASSLNSTVGTDKFTSFSSNTPFGVPIDVEIKRLPHVEPFWCIPNCIKNPIPRKSIPTLEDCIREVDDSILLGTPEVDTPKVDVASLITPKVGVAPKKKQSDSEMFVLSYIFLFNNNNKTSVLKISKSKECLLDFAEKKAIEFFIEICEEANKAEEANKILEMINERKDKREGYYYDIKIESEYSKDDKHLISIQREGNSIYVILDKNPNVTSYIFEISKVDVLT